MKLKVIWFGRYLMAKGFETLDYILKATNINIAVS
jgi:hypothetical protein